MDAPREIEIKAHAIEKRHQHQCSICMLIDTDNREMKFYIYSEALSNQEEDSEICEGCLKDLALVRKRCEYKVDNPNHNPFENFMPSFIKDMPGLREAFKKILV